MNIITAILTMICQVFTAIFGPLFRRFRPRAAAASETDNRARKIALVILAIAVIVGSAISLYYRMQPVSRGKINRDLFIALGQALADETAGVLHDKGRIIVVVTPDYFGRRTATHLELDAFQRQLKKHAGINIIDIKQVTVPETDPDQNLPRVEFEKALNIYPQPAAIVSFIGLPTIDPENPLTLERDAPKIIAIYNAPGAAKAYFTNSIATLLIVPRVPPGTQATVDKTPRESFDRFFRVCTAANYESIPD